MGSMSWPAKMSVTELRAGLVDLSHKIYSADFTEQRRRRFFKRQLELREARAKVDEGRVLSSG